METKEIIKHALKDYQNITGLRSYVVYDNTIIQSASERNYSCRCLKSSSKALKKCEECIKEIYENAREIDRECVHSCHADLIKWAVPVQREDLHCVIVSEDVLVMKQMKGANKWAGYLSREYRLDESVLLKNFKVIQTMDEDQMNASIELLKDLLSYHLVMAERQAQRFIFIQWKRVCSVRESLKG